MRPFQRRDGAASMTVDSRTLQCRPLRTPLPPEHPSRSRSPCVYAPRRGVAAREEEMTKKTLVACSMVLLSACGNSAPSGDATPPRSAAHAGASGQVAAGFGRAQPGTGQPGTAQVGESFFAGPVPAGVTMKATKTFAMGPGILMIQGVEGWSGGQLPGYDYMAMSKDSTAVVRVTTSTGVVGEMNCKELATAAAMAPLRAKNLRETTPAALRKVGKNQFVAREGVCAADGPKGPVQIHFINILRKDREGLWHYAVLAAFPQDAPQSLKDETKAWARSLEYNGQNGYSLP